MTPSNAHAQLLALCAVESANWHVIAREAQRPDGLKRLLAGEVIEHSREATETRQVIRAALKRKLTRELDRARGELERATGVGAELVTVLDEHYPANLRVIFNLPPFLFHVGQLRREDALSVAVVGTRQASPEGLKRAKRMARLLTEAGVTVISGLALGIDAAAHAETLDRGGRTIAVLGTGILRTYPSENAKLAKRIAASGALVSQFWPSQPPTRYTFPRRNVVTSGLGQGTVVIEASRTSGAKMQAGLALEHGKQVFLLRQLVAGQGWARKFVARGAIQVNDVGDVVNRLRSLERVEQLTAGRQQLALELAV